MSLRVVKINCYHQGVLMDFYDSLHRHLSNFDEYNCTKLGRDHLIVNIKTHDLNIQINLTYKPIKDYHVCLIHCGMVHSCLFSDYQSERARNCKKLFRTIPILLVCQHSEWKYVPRRIKEAELRGDKLMTREIGDNLVCKLGKIGAVKYIEYSEKTGRGAKILIDEIAFAGIAQQRKTENCRLM